MSGAFKRIISLWEITIAEHQIKPCYAVPCGTVTLGGSEDGAKLRAIRWAHADAHVPPIKSYIRESWPHVTAKKIEREVRA